MSGSLTSVGSCVLAFLVAATVAAAPPGAVAVPATVAGAATTSGAAAGAGDAGGAASAASAGGNLVRNGALEPSAAAGPLPQGWEPMILGAPAGISLDAQERRDGVASVRIDAAEVTRAYLRSSEPIDVAPGEAIEASAWVKVKPGSVPPGQGTVILIAEFADLTGAQLTVEKFGVADTTREGWQPIRGSVQVPPAAAQLRLRMGFSYSCGTCWWDGLTVTARRPLVCRLDLPRGGRLSPAATTLPVTILNRDRHRGAADLLVTVGNAPIQTHVELTGALEQRVDARVVVPREQRVKLRLHLTAAGGDTPFTTERVATVAPPLAIAPPSPTHWVIEDGSPVIETIADLAVSDAQRNGARLIARVLDEKKESRASATLDRPADGPNPLILKPDTAIPQGDYRLIVELRSKDDKPIAGARAEQPWRVIRRRQARVTLDGAGFPVHDGKAIFPLGIFNGGRFQEQAEAGFNLTHAYNAARIHNDPFTADQRAFDFIEKTHHHGMKMLFMIPMQEAIDGDFQAVCRRVRMFRNHPALLAWDEEEGFARGDFKPDTLKRIRRIIDEEDPHHPLMVGDSADVIDRSRGTPDFFPDGEMDLGMWWWYPFPLRPQGGAALQGEDGDARSPGRWDVLAPPVFLTRSATTRPLWVGVQAYKKPSAGARYPTPAEYRAQAYLAIISGARGLMWYGGSVTGGIFHDPENAHWTELRTLVRELRDREPFWLAPSETPAITPPDAPIAAAIKRAADGRALLVALNRGPDHVDATIAGEAHHFEPYAVVLREQPAPARR